MSATPFGPPYRSPCDGWEKKLYLGCADNFRSSENNIPEFVNVTKVPQDEESDPTPVNPFPVPNCDYFSPPCTAGGVNPFPCSDGDIVFGNNCYQSTGRFLNLAKCGGQIGFKNVMAYLPWQGCKPYTSLDDCSCADIEGIDISVEVYDPENPPVPKPVLMPDPACCHTPIQSNPLNRFRIATFSGVKTERSTPLDTEDYIFVDRSDISLQMEVDKNTGIVKRNAFFYNKQSVRTTGRTDIFNGTFNFPNFIDHQMSLLMLDQCPVGRTESDYYISGIDESVVPPTAQGYHGSLAIVVRDNSYTYEFHGIDDTIVMPDGTNPQLDIAFSVTLSGVYNHLDLWSDWQLLLNTWSLADNIIYPWRTDELITSAPLVQRDCNWASPFSFGIPPAETSPGVPWVDGSQKTGAILGAPTPAGYEPFWKYDFPNWLFGFPPGYTGTDPIFYIDSYGSYSPDWCPHATNWTDVRLAGRSYPGSWSATSDNGLIGGKWAETYLFAKPSHNFDRPCGERDRDARNQTSINCDTNPEGDLLFTNVASFCGQIAIVNHSPSGGGILFELAEPATGLRTGDLIDFTSSLGIVEVSGLSVTVVDEKHFIVYTSIFSSFVQSHGAKPFYWNDTGVKGNFISQIFEYDYRDIGEISRLRTAYLQRVQDNDYRASHQRPPLLYPPCDTLPNPDQIRNGSALKDINIQTGCISFSPCDAAVIYCSPNVETFKNSYSVNFPIHVPDLKYGSRWQQHFYQWMIDPLWQAPVCPCSDRTDGICNYILAPDDGSCGADEPILSPGDIPIPYKYYQIPYEEALGSIPNINEIPAPELPLGLRLGCTNIGTSDAPNWVGPECQEIPFGEVFGSRSIPWVYWLKQLRYNCPDGAAIVNFSFE